MSPGHSSRSGTPISPEAAEGLRRFLHEVPKTVRDQVVGICRDSALILPAEAFEDPEPHDAADAQDCYHWRD